jgi:hypothetical protein
MRYSIRNLVLGFALLASAGVACAADWGVKSTERSIETNTANLQLPYSAPGELGIVQCDTCKRISLHVTGDTQILIGKSQVSLADLREFLNSAGREHFAMVFYGLKDTNVIRLTVSGEFNGQRHNR